MIIGYVNHYNYKYIIIYIVSVHNSGNIHSENINATLNEFKPIHIQLISSLYQYYGIHIQL